MPGVEDYRIGSPLVPQIVKRLFTAIASGNIPFSDRTAASAERNLLSRMAAHSAAWADAPDFAMAASIQAADFMAVRSGMAVSAAGEAFTAAASKAVGCVLAEPMDFMVAVSAVVRALQGGDFTVAA